ncbi:MAG: FecCD family ABC transporter permease [Pyrinomonadaceae bacterium]
MKVDGAKEVEAQAAVAPVERESSVVRPASISKPQHSFTVSSLISFSAAPRRSSRQRAFVFFLVTTVLLLCAIVIGIAIGSTRIEASVVMRVLLAHVLPAGWVDASGIGDVQQAVVWLIRAPRVIVAALVGAALAIAGAQMQGLFKNPLASPDIVGTSSGGALGAVLSLATGLATRSLLYLPLFSFVGALVALFVVYFISTRHGRTPIATLLLAGVALNALIGAATSFLITMTWVRFEVAQEILFWLLGGLDNRTWAHVWLALPCVVVGAGVALFYSRELDLLLMGEEAAASLGVEVENVKRIILVSAALLTGAAVAVSGVIGFVGLIVPHIVRLLIGPAHRRLIPASALTGAVFIVVGDLLARTLLRPEEIRLGIITAAFGAPFFLYLLLRHRRELGYS